MSWHQVRRYLAFSMVAFTLVTVVSAEWSSSASAPGWLQVVSFEIQAACRDAGTQWMVTVCLVSYFVTFLFLERRLALQRKSKEETAPPTSGFQLRSSIAALIAFFRNQSKNPHFWLVGFVGMVLLRYAFAYETAARSLQPLVLLAGIILGKGIALWSAWRPSLMANGTGLKLEERSNAECPSINSEPSSINKARAFLYLLILLLACASQWQPEYGMEFQYRGYRRWTGPWDNPNTYGLLVGVGFVLGIGQAFLSLKSKGQSHVNVQCGVRGAEWRRWARIILLLSAAGLCALGLVKSYSRGAWVGTVVGVLFLIWNGMRRKTHLVPLFSSRPPDGEGESFRPYPRPDRSWLPLSILLASIFILTFWQFRHTESPLARRVFSIGNPNDFSWRNRVSTWAGAVTMMKDRPLLGYGWGKSETVFGEKYKPVRLADAAAIQMNDYLMLGISCGAPALLCFVTYILLSGRWAMGESRAPAELLTVDLRFQTPAVGFAGATVLLVGFWFDGGLFKLPTAVLFWALLELSRGSNLTERASITAYVWRRPAMELASPDSSATGLLPLGILLRWLAGILALLAVGQTVLHLGAPQLVVGERTLFIARRFLVPSKAEKDFEFLALQPIWSAKKLGTLLDHVELANYNRELVNWKLEDDVYRRFVLSSQIDTALDGDMNWRRPLWENFYPRIRRENSLEAAAEIVVRQLRERIVIIQRPKSKSAKSIAETWWSQSADENCFEALYVAALRSSGIPSRLSQQGQAEFWNGSEWKLVPRPVQAIGANG